MNDVDSRLPHGAGHNEAALGKPLYGGGEDEVAHFSPGPPSDVLLHGSGEHGGDTALWGGTGTHAAGAPMFGAEELAPVPELTARRLDAEEAYHDDLAHEEDYDPEHEYDTRAPKSAKTKLVFGFLALIFVGFVGLVIYGLFFKGPKNPVEQYTPPPVLLEETKAKPPIANDPMSEAAAPRPVPAVPQSPTAPVVAPAPAPVPPPADVTGQMPAPAMAPVAAAPTRGGAPEADGLVEQNKTALDLAAQIADLKAATAAGAKDRADLVAAVAALQAEVSAIKTAGRPSAPTARAVEAKIAKVTRTGQQAEVSPPPQSISARAERPKRVTAPKASAAADVAGACTLKGADDGIFADDKKPVAWIADSHSSGEAYHVGQSAPCVGQIYSIAVVGDNWVVVGTNGRLALSAGGRN